MVYFSDLILPSQKPHTDRDIIPQKTEDIHCCQYSSQNLDLDDMPSSINIPYLLMDSLWLGLSHSEPLQFSSILLEYRYREMGEYLRMGIELV